jgi:hypothetical protein
MITFIKNKPYCYIYYDSISLMPFYVGKGTNKRALKHLKETLEKTDNPEKVKEIQRILQLGQTPIIKVMYTETENEAFELEIFFINFWGLRIQGGLLTNLIYGGKNGYIVGIAGLPKSEDHKRKIGEGNKLANKNPETTERKRKAALGNTRGSANKGRIITWGDKISAAAIERLKDPTKHPMYGKHQSKESKEQNRQSHLGKTHTKEHNEAIGISNTGKIKSQKTKDLIAEKLATTWEITFLDGHKEKITNLRQFCKNHNLKDSNFYTWGHTKGYRATKIPESQTP